MVSPLEFALAIPGSTQGEKFGIAPRERPFLSERRSESEEGSEERRMVSERAQDIECLRIRARFGPLEHGHTVSGPPEQIANLRTPFGLRQRSHSGHGLLRRSERNADRSNENENDQGQAQSTHSIFSRHSPNATRTLIRIVATRKPDGLARISILWHAPRPVHDLMLYSRESPREGIRQLDRADSNKKTDP
jgi:hypothetical protein